jgi:hypothetical protein
MKGNLSSAGADAEASMGRRGIARVSLRYVLVANHRRRIVAIQVGTDEAFALVGTPRGACKSNSRRPRDQRCGVEGDTRHVPTLSCREACASRCGAKHA